MRYWGLVPVGLLAVGALLVGLAALQGGAQLAVVVIVPVIYGRSLEFAAGVLLLIAGLFSLPLAFDGVDEDDEAEPASRTSAVSEGTGGLVLIGPIPVFFGSWQNVPRRTRLAAAIVGGVVLVVAVLVLVWIRP